jgi:hypothetical protein
MRITHAYETEFTPSEGFSAGNLDASLDLKARYSHFIFLEQHVTIGTNLIIPE